MFDWLVTQTPDPTLVNLGFIKVYWYGFLVSLAIVLGLVVTRYLYKRYNFKRDLFWDLSFYVIIFAFLGDRLAHVMFYNWEYYSHNLIDVVKVWEGGLAIHGAIFVGLLMLYVLARKHKFSFTKLGDVFVPGIALGLAIGRWGNYFNQEIYGLPSDSWLAIPIDLAHRVSGFENYEKFLPMFLYASILNLVIFLILILIHKLKLAEKIKIADGAIMASFLVLYGLGRFILEFWRIDIQNNFLGLRTGQYLSLALIVLAIAMIIKYFFVKNKSTE